MGKRGLKSERSGRRKRRRWEDEARAHLQSAPYGGHDLYAVEITAALSTLALALLPCCGAVPLQPRCN